MTNRPDITVKNKTDKICLLMNVIKKRRLKIKYKDLRI